MFNSIHISYIVISILISAAVIAALCKIKNGSITAATVRFLAVITVVIHFSGLWYEYFTTGSAVASMEYIFPMFPCHICMWLLIISANILKRDTLIARIIKDFTFWGGTVCGTVGILLNENFAANSTLTDYHVLKGLLSHSTMVLGCILLLVGGFVKIGIFRSFFSVMCGLTLFLLDGLFVNFLFKQYGLGEPNAMYLQRPPFESLPIINTYTIAIMSLSVTLLTSIIYKLTVLLIRKKH